MKYIVNDNRLLRALSLSFRRRRMQRFMDAHKPAAGTRILDVGGYPATWQATGIQSHLVLLNLHPVAQFVAPGDLSVETAVGDGCALPYEDKSFDIVFSNSVLEHLGSFENQKAFAREARRVGRRLWIQTPARWCPFEPHLMTPLIHFLPRAIRRHLLRNFTLWGWITRPSQPEVDDFLAEVRLLTYREMKELFPDCLILRERFFGFTKSYMAVRGSHAD